MIHFPPLRTGRLDVQLRELTIAEAVALAAVPAARHEANATALLRCIVDEARGEHSEPGRWTVQERMLVVAHYIACTSEEANFALGGEARFLDYLMAERDTAEPEVDAGEACGDAWRLRQLTGDEAAAVEALCSSRMDWVLGDMAARLRAIGDAEDAAAPDATAEPGLYADWIAERKAAFGKLPESDFEALFGIYRGALPRLDHLFLIDFDAEGHFALPARRKEGGAALAPARFPVASTLSAAALELGARAR